MITCVENARLTYGIERAMRKRTHKNKSNEMTTANDRKKNTTKLKQTKKNVFFCVQRQSVINKQRREKHKRITFQQNYRKKLQSCHKLAQKPSNK